MNPTPVSYTHLDVYKRQGQLYYKVVAIGKASNLSEPSKASNAIAPQYINYAQGSNRVTVSGQTNANEAGSKAVDGSLSSKWCQTGISSSNPAWLRIDLTLSLIHIWKNRAGGPLGWPHGLDRLLQPRYP